MFSFSFKFQNDTHKWCMSSRRFKTFKEAGEAAIEWAYICALNDEPIELRIVGGL